MAPPIKPQAFLVNLPLFSGLAPDEIDRLAAGTTEQHVPRGEIVVHKGDPCTGFHAVVYGQVKLSLVTQQGQEKVLEIIGPGFSFGEALMFMGKRYIVMATALADSMLLHVSRDVVFAELARDPEFARKMLAGLSRKLHNLITDIEAVTLKSGAQRVIGYLLRQDESQADSNASYKVTLPVSKAVAASRLNLTPEHFSRILHELAGEGLIRVDGREVTILDPSRLRASTG
jgi:CRP-like cAMP-binding protein